MPAYSILQSVSPFSSAHLAAARTVALGRMRLCIRVYAHEVQHLVVVARVHDYPPVVRIPHQESALVRNERLCNWVRLGDRARDKEAEGSLSGAEWLRVFDVLSRQGLSNVSESLDGLIRRQTYVYTVSSHDDISSVGLAIL